MLEAAATLRDPLLVAEHLRLARVALDALLGRTTTEQMLDALFARFCIGKVSSTWNIARFDPPAP